MALRRDAHRESISEKSVKDEGWAMFFPPGTRVLALPGWRSPRLLLPSEGTFQRWRDSSLYPASRLTAKIYRLVLRLRATARLGRIRTADAGCWPLRDFAGNAVPELANAVVLVGTPGPAQEITVQLRAKQGPVLGYLKYADKPAARMRLRHEGFMLSNLPQGIGPELIKMDTLTDGEALLNSPVPGKLLAATLPPPRELLGLLGALEISAPISANAHPWVRRTRAGGAPEDWFKPLMDKEWPVTILHGDFAPWNILVGPDGSLRAIDWEYGILEGFPYLDLAHYLLQTSALIYRRSPMEAVQLTVNYLVQETDLAPDRAVALALTRLAAYSAFQAGIADGQRADDGLQLWRREVFGNTIQNNL